jgi:hypothetical protein
MNLTKNKKGCYNNVLFRRILIMNKKIYETPEIDVTFFRSLKDIMAGDDPGVVVETGEGLSHSDEDDETMPIL